MPAGSIEWIRYTLLACRIFEEVMLTKNILKYVFNSIGKTAATSYQTYARITAFCTSIEQCVKIKVSTFAAPYRQACNKLLSH